MQTQRTILWVIFATSLFFLWDAWMRHTGQPGFFSPNAPAVQAPGTASDTRAPGARSDASVPTASAGGTTVPGTAAVPGAPGVPPTAATAAGRVLRLANDVLALEIDSLGGEVRRAELLRHRDAIDNTTNVLLFTSGNGRTYVAQSGLIGAPDGQSFPTHRTPFQAQAAEARLAEGAGEVSLSMTSESGGLRVTKTYTLARGSYEVKVRHEIANVSGAPLSPTLYLQLARDSAEPADSSKFYSTYTGPVVYSDADKFQKVDWSSIGKGNASHTKTANDGWVAIIQHYFLSAWVPRPADAPREFYTRKVDADLYTVGIKQPLAAIAPGATATVDSDLFVGPQDQPVLEKVAPGLDLAVDYGWLTVVAKPIYWLLQQLHKLVGNWGWAIVLLTIVIKTIFFPLQAASYRSMARMKKVTPKLMALREKFGDDRVKLNAAMMELYKTEKINPLGGCLPIVVQIPVFIALYWVLLASVEMRDAPWIGWIRDLAAPDPFYVLPLVMAATMIIQTRLNPTPPDPMQARMMQIMPIVFSVMFFFFPAGLVLYWLVNNIYSIVQQWVITKRVETGHDPDKQPVKKKLPAK